MHTTAPEAVAADQFGDVLMSHILVWWVYLDFIASIYSPLLTGSCMCVYIDIYREREIRLVACSMFIYRAELMTCIRIYIYMYTYMYIVSWNSSCTTRCHFVSHLNYQIMSSYLLHRITALLCLRTINTSDNVNRYYM